MTRPYTLPDAGELAARHGHGHRVTYISGCRCEDCRESNAAYERERAALRAEGDWNGLTPAAPVRAHIDNLLRAGMSQRLIANQAGVPRSLISLIVSGKRRRIRARNARHLLAVVP